LAISAASLWEIRCRGKAVPIPAMVVLMSYPDGETAGEEFRRSIISPPRPGNRVTSSSEA
jgi:hypothetical protein